MKLWDNVLIGEERSMINLRKLHNRPDQREAMVDPDRSISKDIPFEKKLIIKQFYKSITPRKGQLIARKWAGFQIVAIEGNLSIKPIHIYQ